MRYTKNNKNMRTLRSITSHPQVYALVLNTDKGTYLHVGVHTSLDEAFSRAKSEAIKALSKGSRKVKIDADIDMWSTYNGNDALNDLSDGAGNIPIRTKPRVFHSNEECAEAIDEARNALMARLVENKSTEEELKKNRKYLSTYGFRYVKDKIKKNETPETK